MPDQEYLSICTSLADRKARASAAERLSRLLNAESIIVFIQDPALDIKIPAPGFPQSLPGGIAWRNFISECRKLSAVTAELLSPYTKKATNVAAIMAEDGTVLAMLGGSLRLDVANEIMRLMPLVSSTLKYEHVVTAAEAQLSMARESAKKAQALTVALEETRANLQIALSDRDRLVRELEEKATELNAIIRNLQEESDVRDIFVSTLTHDLRTPLAAAKMGAQTIIRNREASEGILSSARRIVATVDRASDMVTNLLDANFIRSGGVLHLSMEECNLNQIATKMLEELSIVHGERFELCSNETIHGYWNGRGVRRILENLVSNGIKYGDKKGKVRVSLRKDAHMVEISVHNEGPAIPKDEQSTLFDRFRRTKSARTGTQAGWGLGLTLVKGLAQAHGGEVTLESDAGSGTTFRVRMPLDARTVHSEKIKLQQARK